MKRFAWLAAAVAATALAQEPAVQHLGTAEDVAESLANEARAAIDRGVRWLLRQQSPEGSWSNPEFPALTALPLWAIVRGGSADTQAVARAVRYILSCAREDGSIWREPTKPQKGGGLSNYNTAICMAALHQVGGPDILAVVQKARRFIAGTQHLGADDYRGGMGYDPETGRPYADLSNSYIAYEAMRVTEAAEDLRTGAGGRADLDWAAAREFLDKIQHKPEGTNDPDAGGFAYHPF